MHTTQPIKSSSSRTLNALDNSKQLQIRVQRPNETEHSRRWEKGKNAHEKLTIVMFHVNRLCLAFRVHRRQSAAGTQYAVGYRDRCRCMFEILNHVPHATGTRQYIFCRQPFISLRNTLNACNCFPLIFFFFTERFVARCAFENAIYS